MSAVPPDLPERLLIAACGGRMLARSAARAGIRPVVLDLYADQDTRAQAQAAAAIPPAPIGLDPAALLDNAARLAPAESGYALVYGSGLDLAPELLERLSSGRAVYGNAPDSLRLIKSPRRFFALLRQLDIPHPATRFEPPEPPQGWLAKPGCGEGGKGVVFCAQAQGDDPDRYYQRYVDGPPLSALFLADGANARIVGFNTLWTARLPGQPFLFAGAMNRAGLDQAQRAQVAASIARLVRATGLRGLNSLDFIADGPVCRVLEINPRPSATLGLYDADFPEGLLARHIRACRGILGEPWQAGDTVRASKAVFAPRDWTAPDEWIWPGWCADRPMPGTFVKTGEPLCTVEAAGSDPEQVEETIRQREAGLIQWLDRAR